MTAIDSSTVPTRYVDAFGVRYAYRRFGNDGGGRPLLCLQHFTGTLDNWDPAIVDALARDREIILFENAGVGRSGGQVPTSVAQMAEHVLRFVDALSLDTLHILGFSLGGFLAQEIAIARPALVERMIVSGSAPEGGEGAGMDRPELLAIYTDAEMPMSEKLKRLFFPATQEGQAAAAAFVVRLAARSAEPDLPAGPEVASAQLQAMIAWANWSGDVAQKLSRIRQPVLVTNGDDDRMIPTANSFVLAQGLPNATLIVYPNSGHGALFQYAQTYVAHVTEFLRGA
ncbi:alpha/beta fold hydrolase [Burkholderia multivorans]|uniref:Predicted hydrolase or acyltransferase n=1 Tax=Burkholderia multivorans (strain ATCC 17616 / 249) TaxID=395019 RepID=A0A0H3KIX9_BURM1|nr:alpha/beta hydrolase [Burkholderia multivorans]ABX18847.1 alpha/beta hydrolase fold [Burkholderia multivorans ATCC 17616]AIO72173.1 dienelactone hydrolase family protein [Burkholderia multivorans]AOK64211.1 alpha/beta hydrolase [Burkholderia multivorans]KGB91214.1 dienelactone hydrolase family protein [Burkholderia multivorans]KVZ78686.1 alpha/beta hydrolase [Burkholderia multivorans]